MKNISLLFSLSLLVAGTVSAQQLTTPQISQKANVTQTIGLSEVAITYHSPAVRERQIWGNLVPYDKVWRCGANENTVITFSGDVKVEGQPLPAGTYGLHMIPTKDEWTIIFSRNHTSWGSFFYKKEEDALRVNVKPITINHVEDLNYGFTNRQAEDVTAYLEWEKLRVPFTISADVHKEVLQSFRNELRSLPGFSWKGPMQAAAYCMQHNINHEEALKWIGNAISRNKSFATLNVKAGLLRQTGKEKEADEIIKEAMPKATESELNTYGYQLLNANKVKEAIKIFQRNVKQHPDSWNAYDSLADGFEKDGNKAKAIENYKIALKKAPDNRKARIEGILKGLEG